ncbi:DUF2254 domain-containing protein [Nocardiopsis sp. RSe5-2]|uniref:DUF2254 domain-containing protein n=1 Tax=Nocardiopsis endophytica TaxID=3018445 RepID=A0ABT4U3S8_9ACTN|nr:DUF2254 domain-containing protein [Nocardiopsis endophytica]MDA2811604.1 DUF2254 domain-containing protein [Nocardiopsis endophytica]
MAEGVRGAEADEDAGAHAGGGVRAPARRERAERVRESFVLVPLLGMAAAVLLAVATVAFDLALSWLSAVSGAEEELRDTLRSLTESANAVLGTAGPATLTVLGVVFSITLVALQMATGQLTPRVLYLFTRGWVAKLTLAVFLGTFVYTLVVRYAGGLLADEEAGMPFIALVSTAVAMLLVGASLVMFVYFVDGTVKMMRPTTVLDRVGRETLRQIRALPRDTVPAPRKASVAPLEEEGRGGYVRTVRSRSDSGVLVRVDTARLLRWAVRNDAFVRVLRESGDYVATGSPVLEVHSPRRPAHLGRVARAVRTGAERSTFQDPAFGVRQLVDIGVRALSPGVNDPTTAVQCIDRLQLLVEEFAQVPQGERVVRDRKGRVRAAVPLPQWEPLVELAFTELVLFSSGQPQVTRRLAAALDDIESHVPEARRAALRRAREELRRVCVRSMPEGLVEFAQTADHQGIGG